MTHTPILPSLPKVPENICMDILGAERTEEMHRGFMQQIEAMAVLEGDLHKSNKPLSDDFKVLSWNLERCLFPEKAAELIEKHNPSVMLLSEMDSGMARTQQVNTTAKLAELLGMNYLYGLEFFEMDLGSEIEVTFCEDDYNQFGWHGNAILTSAPIKEAKLIRLDDHGHWFCPQDNNTDANQPRVGGRLAIAAIIEVDGQDTCFVSTHLESNATTKHREDQMMFLIKEVEAFAKNIPVLIAGDLNTGNHLPNADWTLETLFQKAEIKGYNWEHNAEGFTTNPSLITLHPERQMKLDWFCIKQLTASNPQIVEPFDNETPLSDHKAISLTIHR
ncbi:endonuclease/exonuclease/phosphatase family protein [Curvivirga aplysinae]|uniref:endonuclease/exonuclease/phosphatase family protein n=1 Tax=Curvivirga aplysinae TaxID=2529852 RepID=UPI0012BC2AAB|nr:endonuclease/exonuclease/phosphatase family protein [Curvivirga aplysinae]MTI10393.1 endonuclease [Curvivirga aplysinae]